METAAPRPSPNLPLPTAAVDLHAYTMTALAVAISALIAAFILAMIRLVAGPTLPDRVIALDLMAYAVIGFMAVYAVYSAEPALLNVALTLGLVAFLGTIAFARFIERLSRSSAEEAGRD